MQATTHSRAMSAPQLAVGVHTPAERLRGLARHWPVLVPVLFYLSSGILVLATNYWSTEQGGHGPIILLTGAWLLWNRSEGLAVRPTDRRLAIALAGIVLFGLFSMVAAITVKQFLQVAGIYGALLFLLYYYVGGAGLRRLWAPIGYLAFLIPPPDSLIVPLTHTLKDQIANAAVNLLGLFQYPVARDGPNLFIGPYELVVAAACSGMNSLVSLLAIGLFYTYLMHPRDWRYALLLAAFIIPIAVFANFVRVIVILLITYYFGDAVGQSVVHDAMGMIVFVIALTTLIALDAALHPLMARRRQARSTSLATEPAHG